MIKCKHKVKLVKTYELYAVQKVNKIDIYCKKWADTQDTENQYDIDLYISAYIDKM